MSARRDVPVLDRFRLLAAFLAVCNHTAPLAGLAPEADFWLTRVLARIAVPFFLMVSGYFLSRDGWRGTGRFLKRTLTLYAAAVLLYLPLNWYNGGFSPLEWLKKLLIDGTLYHLWYFPAVLLGVVIARGLARLGLPAALVLDALRPLRPAPCGRAWKELDLGALRHNARTLRSALSPGCTLMAVVKADGYGHGAVPVARCLRRDGVRAFGVACLAEGIALRKAGVLGTILILGYTPPREVPLLRRWHLTQTVADEAHGRALAAQGGLVRVHLALDTGMHRLGLPAGDRSAIARMYRLKNLRIDGVFSHLCVSDSLKKEDMDATLEQLTLFYDTLDWMRTQNLSPGRVHIQASYGVLNLPPQPCAWARAGIALYGVYSSLSPVQRRLDLKPVLSLRARVASLRTLRPGERAGYGLAFQARQEARLAVVTIGYADGLPRQLPQQGGRVLIRGAFCPMAGRMCMDQLLVDVTALPDVQAGDVVTLIGRDGAQELRAEELAARCGTITNELLSRLGRRLELQKVPRSSQSSGRSAETRG